MKRWAVLVILLYLLILVALTVPLIAIAFYPSASAPTAFEPLVEVGYWAALAVFVAAQAVMLLVPVQISLGRPASQRSVLWPILASGLMMAILATGAAVSLNEFFRKDKAGAGGDALLPWAVLLVFWAGWSLVFHRTSRGAAAADVVTQQCRYLLKGSILELLVAVPTHIVARARDYCCAGFYTFLGIAFGVSVMLFSFGPGLFFLFAARWKKLHPQRAG
jgi:hypothetical protein